MSNNQVFHPRFSVRNAFDDGEIDVSDGRYATTAGRIHQQQKHDNCAVTRPPIVVMSHGRGPQVNAGNVNPRGVNPQTPTTNDRLYWMSKNRVDRSQRDGSYTSSSSSSYTLENSEHSRRSKHSDHSEHSRDSESANHSKHREHSKDSRDHSHKHHDDHHSHDSHSHHSHPHHQADKARRQVVPANNTKITQRVIDLPTQTDIDYWKSKNRVDQPLQKFTVLDVNARKAQEGRNAQREVDIQKQQRGNAREPLIQNTSFKIKVNQDQLINDGPFVIDLTNPANEGLAVDNPDGNNGTFAEAAANPLNVRPTVDAIFGEDPSKAVDRRKYWGSTNAVYTSNKVSSRFAPKNL